MASNSKTPGILLRNAGIFNPVLVQAVGLCPVVAMATSVKSAALLAAVAAVIITLSELIASLFLKPVPRWVRIGIYIILGGAMVSPLMILIEKLNAPLFGELGIYLPVMAVNSLIVLRCERFAVKIKPASALLDGLTASAGYAAVLLAVGIVREILGKGSLFGLTLYSGRTLTGLLLPFGGFIMLGFFSAALRALITKYWPKYLDKKQPKPGAKKHKLTTKPETKPQPAPGQKPRVQTVPEFTADEAVFTLEEIAEQPEEEETAPPEPAEPAKEEETEAVEEAPEIQPEAEPAEEKEEKKEVGFKELTIDDIDSEATSDTDYSDSDDELEMLMGRSIGDILQNSEKEENKE